jgi:hypothetical protein
VFDQFEFDTFSSEESLEIHVASRATGTLEQFRDLREFVAASVGEGAFDKLGPALDYSDLASCSSVRAYLQRFAQIDVPDPCPWKMYVLYVDDLEWDGFFESPSLFIRYHWSSTA